MSADLSITEQLDQLGRELGTAPGLAERRDGGGAAR